MARAAAIAKPPTLPELRELLGDLYHDAGQRPGHDGQRSLDAYKTIRWLVSEYLTPDEARD